MPSRRLGRTLAPADTPELLHLAGVLVERTVRLNGLRLHVKIPDLDGEIVPANVIM